MKTKNVSVRLTPKEESALNRIAESVECQSRHGKSSGMPSWRVMLQQIASGRVGVFDRLRDSVDGAPPKSPLKVKPAKGPWKGFWKFRAKWWKPIEDSTMMAEDAVAASGMTIDQLTGGGLDVSDCGMWLSPPDAWKGWKWRKSDAAPVVETPTAATAS